MCILQLDAFFSFSQDPFVKLNKLPDPETSLDAVIVGLSGVVVDLKVTPYASEKHIDIWHALEVRGLEYRVVMEVAAWEAEGLLRYV